LESYWRAVILSTLADEDYGYVGTGKGTITLYKGQEVVKKNISEKDAVNALINFMKEHGDWVEHRNVKFSILNYK